MSGVLDELADWNDIGIGVGGESNTEADVEPSKFMDGNRNGAPGAAGEDMK